MKFAGLDVDNFALGNMDVDKVMLGADEVWTSFSGVSPLVIVANGSFTAGVDFPANKDVLVEVMGGGGQGGTAWVLVETGGGGKASTIVSATVNKPSGVDFPAIIGAGGTNGSGSESSMFDIVSAGGDGGCHQCGNREGEDSSWGLGGGQGEGIEGKTGAGGAGADLNNTNRGNGGRGEIRLSW